MKTNLSYSAVDDIMLLQSNRDSNHLCVDRIKYLSYDKDGFDHYNVKDTEAEEDPLIVPHIHTIEVDCHSNLSSTFYLPL
jgi:hypothetical protein